jgi:hypothetical protein
VALGRLLGDPVVPLDYGAAATDLREQLEALAAGAGSALDLGPAVEAAGRLEGLCGRLMRVAASVAGGGRAAAINACLHDLGRLLVAATYTAAGPYGHDPALETGFLPGLRGVARLREVGVDSDAGKLLRVDLVRAHNAVADAAQRAVRCVAGCLAALGARPPARASVRTRRTGRRAPPRRRPASRAKRRRGTSA